MLRAARLGDKRRRSKGPRRAPEREIQRLEREVKRLERDCARSQALQRAQQRAAGIAPPRASIDKKEIVGRKRRKRRPVARALKAAKALERLAASEVSLEAPARRGDDQGPQTA